MNFAFVGFRHNHILKLYNAVSGRDDLSIAACCEEDEATRQALAEADRVKITHDDYKSMLAETDCDVVAVGDYYSKHGELIVAALKAGKHVIADKPLCTSLDELDEIETLAAEKKLSVQCMLDLRSLPQYMTLKQLIDEGAIGDVHTIMFQGLHPLLKGSRPAWYFEEDKHGGTINDIAIHGIDLSLWLTGQSAADVVGARAWNAAVKDAPDFQDAAQLMLRLGNGCGIIADVSYLAPTKCGFAGEQYWRVSCHGSNGMAETYCGAKSVKVATHEDEKPREISLCPQEGLVYLESLLIETGFKQGTTELTTQDVLRASRIALMAQQEADAGKF